MSGSSKTFIARLGFMALIALGLSACDADRPLAFKNQLEKDAVAPQLLLQPQVAHSSTQSVTVSMRFDESGSGVIHVFPANHNRGSSEPSRRAVRQLNFSFERAISFSIEIDGLNAGQEYITEIRVRDRLGNEAMIEPAVGFRTLDESVSIPLNPRQLSVREGVDWEFSTGASQSSQLSLIDAPDWLKLDRKRQVIFGTPRQDVNQGSEVSFTLRSQQGQSTFEQSYRITIEGDPLSSYAWHLDNRGQTSFAFLSGNHGADSRVTEVHARGITGRDIKVRVVDTGIQVNHPDLKDNIAEDGHINFELSSGSSGGCEICDPKDPSPPVKSGSTGDHGTAMAGIIAARGWNGIGSRGVAPEAKLVGFNAFAPRINFDDGMLLEALSDGVDIVNFSYPMIQPPLSSNHLVNPIFESLQASSVITHRAGKGLNFIRAAGDWFEQGYDASFDAYNTTLWTTVVGGLGAGAKKSRVSSAGANLWVVAPGGDRGFQSEFARMPSPKNRDDFLPGLITTDISSPELPCQSGYAKGVPYFIEQADPTPPLVHAVGRSSGFNLGWNALNDQCEYTATAHGSAAATAFVSGVVALMLEVNPELNWRDVRHILVKSARMIDRDKPGEYISIQGHRFPRLHPWTRNGAGYFFHNWYGFGLVDAAAAVELADPRRYRRMSPAIVTDWRQGGEAERIPPHSPTGISQTIPIIDSFTIESVQIRLNLQHEDVSHIGIELISPAGTRSILLPPQSGARHSDFRNMVFLSNSFYGESGRGEWSLNVIDAKGGRSGGQITNWSIRFLGHYTSVQ
jgi:subtilisin family serine protease